MLFIKDMIHDTGKDKRTWRRGELIADPWLGDLS